MTSNVDEAPACADGDVDNEECLSEYENKQVTVKSYDSICSSAQIKISVPKLSFLLHKRAEPNKDSDNDVIQYRNGIDTDDELYDTKKLFTPDHVKAETDMDGQDDDAYDQACQYTTDDDGPLDLSLPSVHRRHTNFSDTDSEDSISIEDDKIPEKAAYKKNLIKRYRK